MVSLGSSHDSETNYWSVIDFANKHIIIRIISIKIRNKANKLLRLRIT